LKVEKFNYGHQLHRRKFISNQLGIKDSWGFQFQIEGKRDEFRKYLERTGATEKLTCALMKLYQEEERPEDAIGYIRKQISEDGFDPAELEALKVKFEEMKKKLEKTDAELSVLRSEVKKTPAEEESVLTTKFNALLADDTGNSLLKEYLTEEIFENLKDLKTELLGSLLDNIQCGLAHFDSEIGIFASDQHAYTEFAELFDPVLEDIHEVEAVEVKDVKVASQPDVDWGTADEMIDLDPEGLFIKSVSVSVGRALNGIPFMPTVSKEQLQEVVDTVRKVLEANETEALVGKYHELADMEDEQKTKWIEEGILFATPDDKFMKAAGADRFWPLYRGLFINEKNNFKVWFNAEEHLQITCFNIGGNLKEVYQRLVEVMGSLKDLEFARDKRWGFSAFNLKNVGNTIHVSVKAKVPQLSLTENADKLEVFSEGNNISVKNLGEGLMELTNKKRFGSTEFETVKAFQEGIAELIKAEKCLYA
jgi:arginine kinase